MRFGKGTGLVRDGDGSTAQVHRHKDLGPVLRGDKPMSDHRLYEEDADDGQEYQLGDTDGEDGSYG